MTTVVWPHRPSPFADRHEQRAPSGSPAAPAMAASAGETIRIVMAGGGTGGHLYPGLAVAEALREQLGDRLELIWAATPRPVDQRLLSGFGEAYVKQPVQPMVRKLSSVWAFWTGWRQSCEFWKKTFSGKRVDAVLALGGYAAGPAAYMGGRFGIPVGLLNPDALPGLANRFLLRRADRVFVQWSFDDQLTKRVRGRVLAIGCPIRKSLFARTRVEGAARLSLDSNKKTLVITGASLGAKTINEAMILLMQDVEFRQALRGWQVLHLAGLEQAAAVKAAYLPINDVTWQVVDYTDDMSSVWAVADLAVARAGASTCAELTACGVPSILVPYPFHKDLHQHHNAAQLVEAGAAREVADRKNPQENAAALKESLLALLYDHAARDTMARQAREAGKPNAAAAVARELLSMVRPASSGS